MEKTKFTPGPWKIGKTGGTVVSLTPENIYVEGAADEEAKEYYGGFLVGESIQPGNALLIQLAPEMFELLAKIKDNCESGESGISKLIASIKPLLERAMETKNGTINTTD